VGRSRRHGVNAPAEARGGVWVAGQLVIGAVVLVLGFVGPEWPSGVEHALRLVGLALVLVGAFELLAGGAFLGASLTPYPRPVEGGSLRRHGVYRFVRHPMYGGVIVMSVGWSLATTPVALVAALGLGGFLELKSRREEGWLLERYPAYAEYRRGTRWKFVPGVR
jgi:protein-S-isoprenylcysteine O-methyltransferase Ste14